MTSIVDIIGREILDSRGNPTVEVDVMPRALARRSRSLFAAHADRDAQGEERPEALTSLPPPRGRQALCKTSSC